MWGGANGSETIDFTQEKVCRREIVGRILTLRLELVWPPRSVGAHPGTAIHPESFRGRERRGCILPARIVVVQNRANRRLQSSCVSLDSPQPDGEEFMTRVNVDDFSVKGWSEPQRGTERSQHYCRQLEEGNILFFPSFPFDFPEEDRAFLRSVRQSSAGYHKNIAYRPAQDKVTGVEKGTPNKDCLLAVLRRFSQHNVDFVARLLPSYARTWR